MTVTMPIQGTVCNTMLNHHLANHCTKFKVSSFSHSRDMDGAPKIKMGSRDVTTPLSATTDQCTKFEISIVTHYKDMKGGKNVNILLVLEVKGHTQGHQQHSHSIECIQLPIRLSYKVCVYLVLFSSYSTFFIESGRF